MESPPSSRPDDFLTSTAEAELSPEEQYPGVQPQVAGLLVELHRRERETWADAERAMEEFERPRGIMGKLFGLRTSVG